MYGLMFRGGTVAEGKGRSGSAVGRKPRSGRRGGGEEAGGWDWKEMAGRRSATGHRRRRREGGLWQRLEGCEEASKGRAERQLTEGSNGDWKEISGRRPAADLQSADGMPPRRGRKVTAGMAGEGQTAGISFKR